mgnify:FL=1
MRWQMASPNGAMAVMIGLVSELRKVACRFASSSAGIVLST